MNKHKLLERQKFVPGKPLPNRVTGSIFSRRTGNYVVMEDDSNDVLDKSFFNFEDELSGMKPAAEQFAETFSKIQEPPMLMEEREEVPVDNFADESEKELGMLLEEIDEPYDTPEETSQVALIEVSAPEESPEILSDTTKTFEFIQCSFRKEDGTRCKRQAPKGKDICSSHQRMLEKQSK